MASAKAPRSCGSTAATASCGDAPASTSSDDEMRDDLGVGLALELAAARDQLLAQRLEVLDDAVVDQRDSAGRVRMGIVGGRRAVGRPAGVGDADRSAGAGRSPARATRLSSLPFGAAADQLAIVDGADAGAVVAAIFHPLEPVDQPLRDQRFPDNRNDPAHRPSVTQILRTMPSNIHCRRNGRRRQPLLWQG